MGKVLVIRGGAIGDFILTLPAIQLLKEGLPEPHVEVLGYKPIAELARAAGLVEDTRSIEHGPLAGFFAPGTELDKEWASYFAGFDLVVSYLHDRDGHFAANLKRAGVKTLLEGISKVDPQTGEHAARQLAKVLENIALFLDDPAPALALPAFDDDTANTVAIHPAAAVRRRTGGWKIGSRSAKASPPARTAPGSSSSPARPKKPSTPRSPPPGARRASTSSTPRAGRSLASAPPWRAAVCSSVTTAASPTSPPPPAPAACYFSDRPIPRSGHRRIRAWRCCGAKPG